MNYFKKLLEAVEKEREAEKERAIREIKATSPEERERAGKAVTNLKGRYLGTEVGGLHLVKFGRSKAVKTNIEVGDVVIVSLKDPLKNGIEGTVTAKTSRSITVAFQDYPPKWVLSKNVMVDLFYNDTTFKRMEEAIEKMKSSERCGWIRKILLGVQSPQVPVKEKIWRLFNTDLNEFQKDAIEFALGSKEFFLIHGPPGTGKTTTLVEIILQLVKSGMRVAASADSNTAADNILNALVGKVNVVRIGHPSRVDSSLQKRTIYYLVEKEEAYDIVKKLRSEAERLIKLRENYTKPEPKYRRGLSDEEILMFAEMRKTVRGIPLSKIISMANWIKINREVEKLLKKAQEHEFLLIKKVLSGAEVVVGTNASFGMDFMEDEVFDVLVHDEGSQATEPSSYIPLVKSKRLIMAGDHKQLPPTILNKDAAPVLSETLFEKLIKNFPENSKMLRIQYRMNEKIMTFSSIHFYSRKLIADDSVKDRTLKELGVRNVCNDSDDKIKRSVDPKEPLVLIDTSHHKGRYETRKKGSTSFMNHLEASIVKKLVECLKAMGIPSEWLGVITPYDDQVKLLSQVVNDQDIEIKSVDGFQGREKEVIVISFVRSNKERNVGFLYDERRLNVALTRAKSKLIIIGDFSTLSKREIYKELRDFVKGNGVIILL